MRNEYLALDGLVFIPLAVGGVAFFLAQACKKYPQGGSLLFLLANLGLIYFSAYASLIALLFYVLLLGIFAAGLYPASPSRPQSALSRYSGISTVAFGLFLLAWMFAKYRGILPERIWTPLCTPAQLEAFAPKIALVGFSYMGFKLIHFFVDYRSGAIEKVKVLDFLSWLFFFPSIVAGPMQRYQDWQEQVAHPQVTWASIDCGIRRILIGLAFKFIFADSLQNFTLSHMSMDVLAHASPWIIFRGAMWYSVYLYFDFAGYTSIAIGVAKFWGIDLPENFNQPYRARNLADFWHRWHLSLTSILREYLFYPISLSMKRNAFFKVHPFLATTVPPILTFLVAGVWHGLSWGFFCFGLLHGVGLAYLAWMGRNKGAKSAFSLWWAHSKVAACFSGLLTFMYLSFSYVFFCLSNDKLSLLWGRM